MTHEEFSFILPLRDNDGAPVEQAHKQAHAVLCGTWGGYTVESVSGVWQNAKGNTFYDDSKRYTVAIPVDAAEYDRFILLMRELLWMARQEALYVKTPRGVEFITE